VSCKRAEKPIALYSGSPAAGKKNVDEQKGGEFAPRRGGEERENSPSGLRSSVILQKRSSPDQKGVHQERERMLL